jgi:hypothetical protein
MPTSTHEAHFKKDTFGTCAYECSKPAREALTNATKIINVHLSFDEALKLNLAIDECVRFLNRYNKAKKAGKRAALNLAIHLDQSRISVHEGKL